MAACAAASTRANTLAATASASSSTITMEGAAAGRAAATATGVIGTRRTAGRMRGGGDALGSSARVAESVRIDASCGMIGEDGGWEGVVACV
jgi:hypothetical protein